MASPLNLREALTQTPSQTANFVPGLSNKTHPPVPIQDWLTASLTSSDKIFQQTGNPSDKDTEVSTEIRIIPDTSLSDIIILLFVAVLHREARVNERESFFVPYLTGDILVKIIRDNFPYFAFNRDPCELNIIRLVQEQHHKAAKARAVSKMVDDFPIQKGAKTIVFVLSGDSDYSWGQLSLWQRKTRGPLTNTWSHACTSTHVPQPNGTNLKIIKWAQLYENCVLYFDCMDFESVKDLCWDCWKWLVMANAPAIQFCTLVIGLNHERLSVAKQDNVLSAVYLLVSLFKSVGPQTCKILILKPNLASEQITQEVLEALVRAALCNPSIRLDNTSGYLKMEHGPRQEPVNSELSTLVANTDVSGSATVQTWFQNLQLPVTWGKSAGTGGTKSTNNTCVSAEVHNLKSRPKSRPITKVGVVDPWQVGPVNERHIFVETKAKTKEEKNQEKEEERARKRQEKEEERARKRQEKEEERARKRQRPGEKAYTGNGKEPMHQDD